MNFIYLNEDISLFQQTIIAKTKHSWCV